MSTFDLNEASQCIPATVPSGPDSVNVPIWYLIVYVVTFNYLIDISPFCVYGVL